MSLINSQMGYKIFSIATGMLIASATGYLTRAAWKTFSNDSPPPHPDDPNSEWKDAITWTLATAVVAGLTRMVLMRGANKGWMAVTGELPPTMKMEA